jgi:hypothetical protein
VFKHIITKKFASVQDKDALGKCQAELLHAAVNNTGMVFFIVKVAIYYGTGMLLLPGI